MLCENLVVAYAVVLYGGRIEPGVGRVYAVYILCKQDSVRADLRGAKHRRRIGREKRTACAAAEHDYLAGLEVFDGLIRTVSFADALNIHRREHLSISAAPAQNISKGKAVHRRCEHTHTVGRDTLDVTRTVLYSAPEVSAADNYADLGTHGGALIDSIADP